MASARDELYDVIIVGSGWSGLLACKHAKAERLSVLVLEKREGIGGVWRYTEDTQVTTVMESTKTSSSRSVTEISDFPMPDTFAEFPRQDQILDYLHKYATKFDLLRHIRFSVAVATVKKDGTEWVVIAKDNREFRARNLVISTGVHQKPNMKLEGTLLKSFTGSIVHSGALKRFNPQHGGKRIMIIGGGETSSDVIDEYYPNVTSIVWSIPRGQHFFRKYGKLLPYRKPQALDKASSRALKFISPHYKSKPGLGWICRWTTSGSLTAYEGHGIPEFRSDVPFLHSFINKQAHVLDLIDYKKLIPKGAIENVNGKTVVFKDGSSQEVEVIILCTGYEVEFPFLPPEHKESPLIERYKYVFSVKDPSLAFIGYVRPMIGSIPGIAEMQARWVSRVFSGRVRLIERPAMLRSIADDKVFWDNYFHGTSQRISTLVEGYTYVDDIARLSGCYPDYWALFKRNPAGALRAYFAPFNGCSFLLNEPEKEEEALRTLRKHSADTFNPVHLLLILLMRFLLFDWFLEKLGRIKYSMQLSPTFKAVKEYKVVKVLDYVWTIPKRCVFDNKTKLE